MARKSILAQFDASPVEMRKAYEDWEKFEKRDLIFTILGGNTVPNWKEPAHAGKSDEWHVLRKRTGDGVFPSPEELRDFLVRHEFLTQEGADLIEDYRYFAQTGKHRRPDHWAARDTWYVQRLGHQRN